MINAPEFVHTASPAWVEGRFETPAFVYDEARIIDKLELLNSVRVRTGCKVLYSIKALSYAGLLRTIAQHVDGFSVSSLFESRLAHEILQDHGSIHLTSPGLRPQDLPALARYCDYLSFNSLPQWQRGRSLVEGVKGVNCGLRINPGLSFVKDERYDPCRTSSKLGVPMAVLAGMKRDAALRGINGIHIHHNCEAEDYQPLQQTINTLIEAQGDWIARLEWINLGGGYLLKNPSRLELLCGLIEGLTRRFKLRVFFEPGKAIVGEAGFLVASVVDLFQSDGRDIAVLDTTVNHLPEVFEYQYRPVVLQESIGGRHRYRLAGASCLSGDLFGDYTFDHELQIGSRIVFAHAGAYMLVKASMFNGINLPTVYGLDRAGNLVLQVKYDYPHYRDRL